MKHLIEWLAPADKTDRRDLDTPRFVYTSSTSVYGQNDGSVVDEKSPTEPLVETTRALLNGESVLGRRAAKNFAAMICAWREFTDRGRPLVQANCLKGEARIEGKGERVFNMIHRDDVIGCVIARLNVDDPGNLTMRWMTNQ